MVAPFESKAHGGKLDGLLKAISDPHRRRILDLLATDELPVGRIAERFRISRPAVIKHLRVLRAARLVVAHRRGRERIQCLNPAPLKSVEAWLSHLEAFWDASLQKLKAQIENDQ